MSYPTKLDGPRNQMPLLPQDRVEFFNGVIIIANPKFPLKAVRYSEDCHMFYEVIQPIQPFFNK